MNKTKIEWCDYTWNPVTGCKRGCKYCYIHDRFNNYSFKEIVYHPDRIKDLRKLKGGERVFVGSMSDVWYWDRADLALLLNHIELDHPKTTFMFLSKDYRSYDGMAWPINTMHGVTMECDKAILPQSQIVNTFLMIKNRRPFFSLEPILGTLKVEIDSRAEIVIVGAMTGPGAVVPKKEWVQSVIDHVPREKIFWKNNIKKIYPELCS